MSWENGAGPFQLQSSSDPGLWSDFGRATSSRSQSVSAPADRTFYRVQDLGDAGLGQHFGQLHVDQGEFGSGYGRQRLKSILDFHLPPNGNVSSIPSTFFRQLTVRFQHIIDGRIETFVGPFSSFPEAGLSRGSNQLTFSWTFETGAHQRDYSLELTFPYSVSSSQNPILLSDPTYRLTCTYASPQPVVIWDGKVETVTEETVNLYEISNGSNPSWWTRDQTVTVGAVSIRSRFNIGLPILQGSPPFIFKTPILQKWNAPTLVSGLTSEPFELKGDYSRSYYPSHHNFVETILLEPELEPGISPAILKELRAANIRIIIPRNPTAFPEEEFSIRILGFDNTTRDL